jgi:hypothetical protein
MPFEAYTLRNRVLREPMLAVTKATVSPRVLGDHFVLR